MLPHLQNPRTKGNMCCCMRGLQGDASDGAAVKINPPVELRLPGTSEGTIPIEYNYVLFPPTKESSSAGQNTSEETVSPDDNDNQKEVQRDNHGSEKGMILENNHRDTREDTRRDAREDARSAGHP